jgi:UDP-3-O-[3-hydroxymyristoyl] glucosamine N-acyltransferase
MADPRFFRNDGPFTLAAVTAKLGLELPAGSDGAAVIADLAGLDGAGPQHLSFYSGLREQQEIFQASRAGFCLMAEKNAAVAAPTGMVVLAVKSVRHAWAVVAESFYPESGQALWPSGAIDPGAKVAPGVQLGHAVSIGAGAEIGEGTRIGPGSAIGPGVTIGRGCDIGGHVTITNAHVGDRVTILPGAQIGQPGYGFASSEAGHVKIPQIGRVIIQDRVEIGANTTIDRGALGDTVIGEGTKIDNLVMIAHNVHIGRHCLVIAQVGIAGGCEIGDFCVFAGQAGVGDHVRIGPGARFAGQTGVPPNSVYEGGADYGGWPAKPVREWLRELHVLKMLLKRQKKDGNG